MQMRCPSYDRSVCLSVCVWMTHCCIVSKRRELRSRDLHCQLRDTRFRIRKALSESRKESHRSIALKQRGWETCAILLPGTPQLIYQSTRKSLASGEFRSPDLLVPLTLIHNTSLYRVVENDPKISQSDFGVDPVYARFLNPDCSVSGNFLSKMTRRCSGSVVR